MMTDTDRQLEMEIATEQLRKLTALMFRLWNVYRWLCGERKIKRVSLPFENKKRFAKCLKQVNNKRKGGARFLRSR